MRGVWALAFSRDGRIYSVAYSPGGKQLATSSVDRTLRLWDAATGIQQQSLLGSDQPLEQVAYSADGRYLASAGWDRTARVWDAQTGTQLLKLTHTAPVTAVAFSLDAKTLASGTVDVGVYLNPLDDEKLLELAGQRVTRELSPAECRQYLGEGYLSVLMRYGVPAHAESENRARRA